MDKMVNRRLVWLLESQNIISPAQSGFRQSRFIYDHLSHLKKIICKAFAENHHANMMNIDLEKTYETVWRHRVIQISTQLVLQRLIIAFIIKFLD